MKTLKQYILILMLMVSSFNYCSAQEQPNPPKNPPPLMNKNESAREMFARRLKLTDEQKQTLDKYREEDMAIIKPILQDMFAKRNEYEILTNSNTPLIEKEAKLLILRNEMKDLKAKADEMRNRNMKRFESLLTEEQKVEFEKIKEEGKQRRLQNPRPQDGGGLFRMPKGI